MAIAFLPVLSIRPAFLQLSSSESAQQFQQLQPLFTYYRDTWLNGQFPIAMWSVFRSNIRTNNQVEGWHSRINRHHHPNVFLRHEQAAKELVLSRARLGAAPRRQKRTYRKLEKCLKRLTKSFRKGELTVKECLDVHRF